jgi:hypothetical protein
MSAGKLHAGEPDIDAALVRRIGHWRRSRQEPLGG